MTRSLRARWLNATAFVLLAVVQFVTSEPSLISRFVLPGAALGIAAWLSPMRPRSANGISQAEATALLTEPTSAASPIIVYHRPGCSYCARLKTMLFGVSSNAYWVDIWADEDAAAYVRMVNDGDETVPTVIINGIPHTNPPPSRVRAALVNN